MYHKKEQSPLAAAEESLRAEAKTQPSQKYIQIYICKKGNAKKKSTKKCPSLQTSKLRDISAFYQTRHWQTFSVNGQMVNT